MPASVRRCHGLFAAVLALFCLALPGAVQADGRTAAYLSFGPDYGGRSSEIWRRAVATGEIRSGRTALAGLRPVYSFAVTRRGGVMAGAGLHTGLQLGAVEVTPHFSVLLWQDGRGGFTTRELVQFRTGIDLFVPLSRDTSVGLGYYHVSNAGLTRRSANLDVLRLGVLWRY